jgi:hypothetical protein
MISNNPLSYTRPSVPRHTSATGCTKGMGLLLTSQARDARCLCIYVLAIYTSKLPARTSDEPSKAWVAWSLAVWHRVGTLRCVARRSSISVRSRLRGRLAGGHGQVHDPILYSSTAFCPSPIQSRSCRGSGECVRGELMLELIGFMRA